MLLATCPVAYGIKAIYIAKVYSSPEIMNLTYGSRCSNVVQDLDDSGLGEGDVAGTT